MKLSMDVTIIGAARRNNGIGEFIARYFHARGASITAVLGTSEQTTSAAADHLRRYGIKASAYTDFSRMISEQKPDAVVIASPGPTHVSYLQQCVDAGVHIFCEKPIISPGAEVHERFLTDLFDQASSRGIRIAMNSQWPFSLPFYDALCGRFSPGEIESFFIHLSPLMRGRAMIPESLPHALSLMHARVGPGKIEDLSLMETDAGLLIKFFYASLWGRCSVVVELEQEEYQPRSFSYGFNGRIVHRNIEPSTYTISLTYRDKTLKIPDPLELSVGDFITALNTGSQPMIDTEHILETSSLLQDIYREYTMETKG